MISEFGEWAVVTIQTEKEYTKLSQPYKPYKIKNFSFFRYPVVTTCTAKWSLYVPHSAHYNRTYH